MFTLVRMTRFFTPSITYLELEWTNWENIVLWSGNSVSMWLYTVCYHTHVDYLQIIWTQTKCVSTLLQSKLIHTHLHTSQSWMKDRMSSLLLWGWWPSLHMPWTQQQPEHQWHSLATVTQCRAAHSLPFLDVLHRCKVSTNHFKSRYDLRHFLLHKHSTHQKHHVTIVFVKCLTSGMSCDKM